MASLKDCRKLVRLALRHGLKVRIEEGAASRAACDLRNPARHRMSGHYAVWMDLPDGSARALWTKDDVIAIAGG